jgi:MOSC domain-containing protein YiiM
MNAFVTAVCVVHQVMDDVGQVGRTAIDKRPVTGRVRAGRSGLAGDTQCDTRHHGGPYQALYAYADEDAAWWSAQLGRPVPPGLFGENLRTIGLDLCGAVIGEQWQLGEGPQAVIVRVTKPRVPCETFKRRMDERQWVRRFALAGRAGVYLKVEHPGEIEAGAPVRVLDRPAHGVTALEAFRHDDPAAMSRLLAAESSDDLDLDPDLRRRAALAASRG